MARRKERPKPTFKYFVRINGADELVDMDTLPKDQHDMIVQKLCDNFMAALGYVPAADQEAAAIRHIENERKLNELLAQRAAQKCQTH